MMPTQFILNSTFMVSVLGLSMHRIHLVSALLCIEGMMLALFMNLTSFTSSTQASMMAPAPIMLLAFSACEAGTGLALLVASSRTHGNDHLQNLSLLQC